VPLQIAFVKDRYVVQLYGFSEETDHAEALDGLASYLAEHLPGTNDMPAEFALFPQDDMLREYAMYFPNTFMGMEFLNHIYGCNCMVDTDTVFLMVAVDSAGPMVLQWSQQAEEQGILQPLPEDIPYDDGKGFIVTSQYYGNILVGVKNDCMAVMFGYDDRFKQYFCDWLATLPEKTI
jgi:hypothetical protein